MHPVCPFLLKSGLLCYVAGLGLGLVFLGRGKAAAVSTFGSASIGAFCGLGASFMALAGNWFSPALSFRKALTESAQRSYVMNLFR